MSTKMLVQLIKKCRLTIKVLTGFICLLSCFSASSADNILFISGSHKNMAKVNLFKQAAEAQNIVLSHQSAKDLDDLNKAKAQFSQYKLVIFSGVSVRDANASFAQFAPLTAAVNQSSQTKFIALNWAENKALNLGLSQSEQADIAAYYDNGGQDNMQRLAQFLAVNVFNAANANDKNIKQNKVLPPIIFPTAGIYHPNADNKVFENLAPYLSWINQQQPTQNPNANQQRVGILFARNLIESASTNLVDATIKKLEAKNITPVAFYFDLSPAAGDYSYLLTQNDTVAIDAIINYRAIHWASKRKAEFEKLGVPVLQGLTYYDGTQADWEASSQGITPNMAPFLLVLPESAGVTDPIIVAGMDHKTGETQIIDYQLDHLVSRAANWSNLKHKQNQDKKITVMVWGDSDVGASYLNVPESLRSISNTLNQQGYQINAVNTDYYTAKVDDILSPFYRSFELDKLIKNDLAELLPLDEYLSWFNQLPENVKAPINEFWGEAGSKTFMMTEQNGQKYFVIPRIRNGNMLVMRQPPRSENQQDEQKYYHEESIPMNHYYLAAYYYARAYWASDAIVHLGTHGSHEYLPGKERGLSLYDQSNLATWHTPVIYPFIVDDVGEAMQTKRRGSATIIAHMTPPFAAAGLQSQIADLHELMHQYKAMDQGGVKQKTAKQISQRCFDENICQDIGWTNEQIKQDFDNFLAELHIYLEELATQNQPLGLHTFGELPEQKLIISTLVQMMGSSFRQLAIEFDAEHEHGGEAHFHQQDIDEHKDFITGDIADIPGYQLIKNYVIEGQSSEHLSAELIEQLNKAQTLYQNFTGIKELEHLSAALNGAYIPVKTGGDPIRHPDSLATGYNLYGFDPARVPTKAAYEQGRELTEQTIAQYYQQHGRYPDKLAFSLWSMETMRHYGVLESQVLAAIGVKPVWSSDGRVTGTEIIPASELKRPRVDVVLSATGLYRDAFPNVMLWMAKAIREITELKEANNSLWDNSQKVKLELTQAGVDADEAEYLSSVRIFSNESGNYGSGLGDSTIASGSWEQDSKLADLYLARMSYIYGEDNSRWGEKLDKVNLYAKTLSGTDIAMFSRSSNIFGMLSSDDPFQYFGGLALAVRNLDGQSPEMRISNLRDANQAKSENAATFLAKELRTRNFHKRWIEEMKKEGYSGAVTMASNLNNFFGWQVMDPNLVRADQWQEFYQVYVEDKLELDINQWFEQINPRSQADMLERMLEANRKDYWQADSETLKNMMQRYQQLVVKYDLVVDNDKLKTFVEQGGQGFGLDLTLPSPEMPAVEIASGENQQVSGQKLEQVKQNQNNSEPDYTLYYLFAACLLFIFIGALRQYWPKK
ncbi:cobaltochelatase subunit CobN [Catenovulum sp. 2E275]|uniref:cobaltochelatase subunit CobN n=1 Tax=Catenovulum sp. 2E275 TaxID=2980497 RepID=UPI0021CE0ED8|nr:cobaltochelatase subunit CobN [Catenovulum sp. 2E275]MCU4677493.1 cobaltochelatase subunit CobN [Catenovulum sp. 2E275]